MVNEPIGITEQLSEARVIEGGTVQLEIKATGTEPIRYEWLFNSELITGADSPILTLTKAGIIESGKLSSCNDESRRGEVSEEVKLTVVEPIKITKQPIDELVKLVEGESILLEELCK